MTFMCYSNKFTGYFKEIFNEWIVTDNLIGKADFIIKDISTDKVTLVFKKQRKAMEGEAPCPNEISAYQVYIAPFEEGDAIRKIFNRELHCGENSNRAYYYSEKGDKVEFDLIVMRKLSVVLNQVYRPA